MGLSSFSLLSHSYRNRIGQLTDVNVSALIVFVTTVLLMEHIVPLVSLTLTPLSLIPFFILGGGGGGGGGGSCPLLYVRNGPKYTFENDFLLGSPAALFEDFISGRDAYKAGQVGPDLYHIQKSQIENGTLQMQIKELEPEESFIDSLSLLKVGYPKTAHLFVDSQHTAFYAFNHDELEQQKGVSVQSVFVKGKKVDNRICKWGHGVSGNKTVGYVLLSGETVEIEGCVEANKKRDLFLFLGASYRDFASWGAYIQKESVAKTAKSLLNRRSVASRDIVKTLGFALLVGAVWVSGMAQSTMYKLGLKPTKSEITHLPTAYADTPHEVDRHSLLLSYWDWGKKAFRLLSIIHPRYNQAIDAVVLPKHVVGRHGKIRLQIMATRRHEIRLAAPFVPHRKLNTNKQEMKLKRVFHRRLQKDMTGQISQKSTEEYLHLVPGDVVDIEFEDNRSAVSKKGNENTAYLFGATGFYTPLSMRGQSIARPWINNLGNKLNARDLLR